MDSTNGHEDHHSHIACESVRGLLRVPNAAPINSDEMQPVGNRGEAGEKNSPVLRSERATQTNLPCFYPAQI